MKKQNYSKFSCFWETEPVGCRRISCEFFHRKPRNINGLYLPPSNTFSQRCTCLSGALLDSWNPEQGKSPEQRTRADVKSRSEEEQDVQLKQDVQGGILHAANHQDSFGNQENILLPSHLPLIINLSDEEDDEEDNREEENFVSNWRPKTTSDIEEERAIRDICCKSGEYYGIQNPHKHQSTKTVSAPWQDELSPLEATEQNLQKGASNTIPTKSNNTRKEKESSERRVPTESTPRTDHRSFDNGGGSGSATQRSRFKTLPWEKEKNPSKYYNVKETNHTELVKNHYCKEVKKKKWISEEPRNSANTVTSKGIQTLDPKVKPTYQQRRQSKNDETASSSPYGKETGRYTYLNSPEPRRSAYVVYRTVTQKPKFNGSTAVPESYGQKRSKQKNQPDTNRRFWTQPENYGKYTSEPSNSPTWKKRNLQRKPISKFKTTAQQSQEDMEVDRKGGKEKSKGK